MLNSGAAVWTGLAGMRDGGNMLYDFILWKYIVYEIEVGWLEE